MSPMRRRRSDPVFMGQPSPSLAKINRMTPQQLTDRIQALEVEAERISQKIKNLSNMQPRDEKRIALLTEQRERLAALQQIAKDRLAGKPPLPEHRPSSGYSGRSNIRTYRGPRTPGDFGSGGSRGYGGGRFPRR